MKPNTDFPSVLLFSSEYPPHIWGGLGTHVRHLAEELSRKNIKGLLFTMPSDLPEAEFEGNHSFTIVRPGKSTETHENVYEWIMNMNYMWIQSLNILQPPFDLIHAHDWMTAGAAIFAKNMYNKPLIATIHSLECGRKKELRTASEKRIHETEMKLIRSADHLIACSRFMKNELILAGAEESKISVIPNGAAPFEAQESNPPLLHPYVFTMGRFVPEKGFEELIHAFAEVKAAYSSLKLVIAGEGPGKKTYDLLTENLGIQEDVIFPGFIKGELLNNYIQYASLACIPSHYEPFGLAALELMSAGKPLIGSGAGGLSELISHNRTGIVCESSRIDCLYKSMMDLLDDPQKARMLGENAKKESGKYSWSKMAHHTLSVYKIALQQM
ncbi:glycosyltransferase family 4 protein [Bacillus sp. FJAT-42376]|uniref:glycosyltransferase family 4 protein n=1 Tax=Bacillus sp. FJAT-42376 TaxID=2014076 RepID=UPI0013DD8799|nr:glycosyltransferase family 4 protein [Bacillus sp. FJAT-42376]